MVFRLLQVFPFIDEAYPNSLKILSIEKAGNGE